MTKFVAGVRRFCADDRAAEVTELGIVLALIVALSVAVIATLGGYVKDAFTTVGNAINPI